MERAHRSTSSCGARHTGASLRDTWNDNHEISVRVEIGRFDLYVTGFYYPEDRRITHVDPRGKRELAEKFL